MKNMKNQKEYEYRINGKLFKLTAMQMNTVFDIEMTIAITRNQCKKIAENV